MNKLKFIVISIVSQFLFGALLCFLVAFVSNNFSAYYFTGSVVGIISSITAMYLYCLTIKNKTKAILFYVLRLIAIFGSILVAFFIDTTFALAVILPHLVSLPIIVVLTVFTSLNGKNT